MSRTADLHINQNTPNAFYVDGLEHLTDELRCLDLRIKLQVLKKKNKIQVDQVEQFSGLFLSEAEINGLLSQNVGLLNDEEFDNSPEPELLATKNLLDELETHISEKRTNTSSGIINLPFNKLSNYFSLNPFEEQCLIICLAPELDDKYEKLYAYLHDDITRKKPTISLAFDLLCPTFQIKVSARAFFSPQAPLQKYRLLQVVDAMSDSCAGLPCRWIKIDDRIADYLLGLDTLDARLFSMTRLVSQPSRPEQVTTQEDLQARTRRLVRAHFEKTTSEKSHLMFGLSGPAGTGKISLAASVSNDVGQALLVADVGRMLNASLPFEEMIWLFGREGTLQSAALCLEGIDCLLTDEEQNSSRLQALLEMIKSFSPLTFFCSCRPWRPHGLLPNQIFIDLVFPVPDVNIRKRLWQESLKGMPSFTNSIDCGALADKFRFSPGQIEEAVVTARYLAKLHSSDTEQISSEHLHAVCRALSNTRLSSSANKINPIYTMQDIVLPPDPMRQLMELCSQARCRHIVYGEWGFDHKFSLGKGLAALFSGPSGTGKTMAAEVIANELQLDLYRIDLSQVVSKYIGETEKNLDRIFTEAQTSNAILFFDEADALFGKRSEVKDAHDRYANIEIGYLLQKMEEYEGITILATNLSANMDEAFVRRLQITVEFPFPDEEYREKIWRSIFPAELPLSKEIDFAFLANRFKFTGGNIKNIAFTSAFYAAERRETVTMNHILQSVRREMQKMGRICTKAELGDYYELLER